jgi:hypothetical protein
MLNRLFPQWVSADALATSSPTLSTIRVGFHDVLYVTSRIALGDSYTILLNTLPSNQQQYLIRGTMACEREETYMNELIQKGGGLDKYTVILYGKHGTDETPIRKRTQLMNLGFTRVYVYAGGLFEWALLQEVYGVEHFPTLGTPPRDLLHYAASPTLASTTESDGGGQGGRYITDSTR